MFFLIIEFCAFNVELKMAVFNIANDFVQPESSESEGLASKTDVWLVWLPCVRLVDGEAVPQDVGETR